MIKWFYCNKNLKIFFRIQRIKVCPTNVYIFLAFKHSLKNSCCNYQKWYTPIAHSIQSYKWPQKAFCVIPSERWPWKFERFSWALTNSGTQNSKFMLIALPSPPPGLRAMKDGLPFGHDLYQDGPQNPMCLDGDCIMGAL